MKPHMKPDKIETVARFYRLALMVKDAREETELIQEKAKDETLTEAELNALFARLQDIAYNQATLKEEMAEIEQDLNTILGIKS